MASRKDGYSLSTSLSAIMKYYILAVDETNTILGAGYNSLKIVSILEASYSCGLQYIKVKCNIHGYSNLHHTLNTSDKASPL